MQEDQFWKKFIFGSFDLRGVFWELRKIRAFSEKAEIGPKQTSSDPPNVLNKLLSKNPTLIRRCEVNKFNLVSLL